MLARQRISVLSLPRSLPTQVDPRSQDHVATTPCVGSPVAGEGLVCSLWPGLNPHKSVGLEGIHPRVVREVADVVARPPPIIFEKSWRSGDIPDAWKGANVIPIYKKGPKEGLLEICEKQNQRMLFNLIKDAI